MVLCLSRLRIPCTIKSAEIDNFIDKFANHVYNDEEIKCVPFCSVHPVLHAVLGTVQRR